MYNKCKYVFSLYLLTDVANESFLQISVSLKMFFEPHLTVENL
jgi:hypothetical protein